MLFNIKAQPGEGLGWREERRDGGVGRGERRKGGGEGAAGGGGSGRGGARGGVDKGGKTLQAGFGSFSNDSSHKNNPWPPASPAPAVSTSVTYVHSRKLFTNFTSRFF